MSVIFVVDIPSRTNKKRRQTAEIKEYLIKNIQ